jgi:hypothetical protein
MVAALFTEELKKLIKKPRSGDDGWASIKAVPSKCKCTCSSAGISAGFENVYFDSHGS